VTPTISPPSGERGLLDASRMIISLFQEATSRTLFVADVKSAGPGLLGTQATSPTTEFIEVCRARSGLGCGGPWSKSYGGTCKCRSPKYAKQQVQIASPQGIEQSLVGAIDNVNRRARI
jgi:hypothetical protein